MDGLQASPHGGREVRSYTANRRELRFGVVAAETIAGTCLQRPIVQLSMADSTGQCNTLAKHLSLCVEAMGLSWSVVAIASPWHSL